MQRRFGVDVDPATEVLALIGSKEGIAHLFPAFVDAGDVTLVPGVGYPVYHTGGILIGGETHYMPMNEANDWLADFESTPADVLAKAKMMFLSYPNNPSSAIATPSTSTARSRSPRSTTCSSSTTTPTPRSGFDGYKPPSFLERPAPRMSPSSCSAAPRRTT